MNSKHDSDKKAGNGLSSPTGGQGALYFVVYGLLFGLSLLPLPVLFLFSDLAYFVLYRIVGYRKQVVAQNLAIAFPEKTETERKDIAKKFYRNFTDNFIETVKLLSADAAYVNKHFTADYSLFEQMHQQGKKCQVHLGHTFNWELANLATAASIPQKLLTVYMPIESPLFEKIFLKIRSATGAGLLPATRMRSAILPWRNTQYALALVADQSPGDPRHAYWLRFFGQPTAFLRAPENGARIANLPVLFTYFIKKKRGYYECVFEVAEEAPATLPKGELTLRYARHLEDSIRRQPELYLWSHRRWKIAWKEEYGELIG